jgi:hypothetical protein
MTRKKWGLLLLPAVLAAASVAFAAKGGKEEEGVIDPKADAQLKKMSEYLAGLKSFRVDTVVIDEKVTTDGQKIQELKQNKLTVSRPASMRVDRMGPNGRATLTANGDQVVVVNHDKNVYAKEKAPASLEALVDELREKLQVDAPGGDFLVSDPYAELTDTIKMGHYIGLEPIGDVMAHHIAVNGKDVDWQLWIQDGPTPVPLRYVITSKDMKSQPEFTIELSKWDPSAQVTPEMFMLTPPANAKRIERGGGAQTKSIEKETTP